MATHTGYEEWARPAFLPPVEWTPAEEWKRITGRQAPYWEARAPMRQLGERLQARYLLGAPEYLRQPTVEPTAGFEDFAGGWIGETPGAWQAGSYQDLLGRAQLAAAATRDPAGEYMAGFTPDTDEWRQAAWYAGMFNPTGGAGSEATAANQLAAATLLARQRQAPVTGAPTEYGGAMGTAIANAMRNLQRYQEDEGQPGGSFLDWYLSRID
jgi:hypothetical protein